MKSKEEIQALIELMCSSLVKRTVRIMWRAPFVKGSSGEVYLDHELIMIDIDPDSTIEVLYLVALHEVAHVLAGHLKDPSIGAVHSTLAEAIYSKTGPFLEMTDLEMNDYFHDPRELEARGIADELDHYARNRSFDLFGNYEVENRISILSKIEISKMED